MRGRRDGGVTRISGFTRMGRVTYMQGHRDGRDNKDKRVHKDGQDNK